MTAETIAAILLAMSLRPEVKADEERIRALSTDFADVADATPSPFVGDAGPDAWGLAFLAVAVHESGLQSWVERCEQAYPGANDRGRSAGLMQVHADAHGLFDGWTRQEICGDRLVQIKAGGHKLQIAARGTEPLAWFRNYAGQGWRGDQPAREIAGIYSRMLARAHIAYVHRGGKLEAVWVKP